MAEAKNVGVEVHSVSSLDASGDEEFELYEDGEPKDLGEAVGLAVGAASMTWPVIGGVFRSEKAKRISEQLEKYVLHREERQARHITFLRSSMHRMVDRHRERYLAYERKIAQLRSDLEVERQAATAEDSEWVPPRSCPPQLQAFLNAVVSEYWRAKAKHGPASMDGSMWSDDRRMTILTEEVGEVADELNDEALRVAGLLNDGVEGGHLGRLLKELVQVGAMAATWGATLMPGEADAQAVSWPETPEEGDGADQPTIRFYSGRSDDLVAVEEGSTVRVPPDRVALMVPRDKLQAAVDAVLGSQA